MPLLSSQLKVWELNGTLHEWVDSELRHLEYTRRQNDKTHSSITGSAYGGFLEPQERATLGMDPITVGLQRLRQKTRTYHIIMTFRATGRCGHCVHIEVLKPSYRSPTAETAGFGR